MIDVVTRFKLRANVVVMDLCHLCSVKRETISKHRRKVAPPAGGVRQAVERFLEAEKNVEVVDAKPLCEECQVLRGILRIKRVFKPKNTGKRWVS